MFTRVWGWIKWLIEEFWKTLSTKPSFLSSKRIERLVFTVTVVAITWVINMYNLGKWTSTDHVITLTPLLLAAGYNIMSERKERKEFGSTQPDVPPTKKETQDAPESTELTEGDVNKQLNS